MIPIIPYRKIWFLASTLLVILSIISIAKWGLSLGIDFTGGSLLEFEYKTERPDIENVREDIEGAGLDKEYNIQPSGSKGVIVRSQEISEDEHRKLWLAVNHQEENAAPGESIAEEKRFESIGPVIGQELKKKSRDAILLVLVFIVLYVAWAFRKVSRKQGGIAVWSYGLLAIVALLHDIIIVMGLFALLGRIFGIEVNTPFVAALLTILGYSVNDTIVVFDRIRENLLKRSNDEEFADIVNKSTNESLVRSFNTSFTTILVLLAIFLFGGETIRFFVLALIAGVITGTYSSIFLASPLLVWWKGYEERKG